MTVNGCAECAVILSAAKDLLSPEPVSCLSRSFVATLLRMTPIAFRLPAESPNRPPAHRGGKEHGGRSGLGAVGFKSGAPSVALHGRAAEMAAERGITSWQLSLTHTNTTAMAVAIAVG